MKDSSEDSDIDDDSWPEFSDEEMFLDDHNSSRLSIKSKQKKKKKWKFSKQLKKLAKDKFLNTFLTRKLKRVHWTITQHQVISVSGRKSMTTCWKFYQSLGRRMKSFQIGHWWRHRKIWKTMEPPLGTLRSPQKRWCECHWS